ncbi:MAG: acyltransferase [Clostridia bacterium]|nr:acyltransferase [Clostridia bacterium]
MKRKITEISVFEFFICIFVITIHLLSEGVDTFPKWSVPSIAFLSLTKLMTFAVPGFVFTSAIKLFYKYGEGKFNYFKFIVGRFLKVYVPYIIAVFIYYIVFVYALELDGFDHFDWNELLGFILRGDISAQFYFVILMVQLYILMPIWILISRIKSNVFGICFLALSFIITVLSRMYFPEIAENFLYFLKDNIPQLSGMTVPTQITLAAYTNRALTSYFVFWISGMYIGINYEKFSEMIISAKTVIYIGWFILAIFHCILSYMQFGGLIEYSFDSLIVVLFCFFSIFGFYIYANNLTISLEQMGKGFLTSIANASYDIYLIHCLIITVMNYYLGHIEMESFTLRLLITSAVTYGGSIIFCVLQSTIETNIRLAHRRRSTDKARKAARRKRYL